MPERGFGVKNVVFCGMRARSSPRRGSARPTPGCRGSRRSRRPCRPARRPRSRRASSATSLREAGHHERLDHRGVGRARPRGPRRRARSRAASAFGIGDGEAGAVDDAEAVLGGHARLERVDRVGGVRRRASIDLERVGEAGARGRRRRAGRAAGGSARCRARRRSSSTTSIMIASAPSAAVSSPAARSSLR